MLGLTDVNIKRLTDGQPVTATLSSFIPEGQELTLDEGDNIEIVVFHATRETVLELAHHFGLDEKVMLDALGEG